MTVDQRTSCACGECASCSGAVESRAVADPLAFRHGAIKRRLLAKIGSTEIEGARPLDALGTRDVDDPTIALLDAFAGALHILAWNAARLSDDGSIRRTEDRDALVDLTRQLGYEPRPAVSATTSLAVTVDAFPGSPTIATVPKGAKVASVPGQDEKPQIFETDEELEARVEWNALLPVQKKATPKVDGTTKSITIEDIDTAAKPGDLVVVYLEPQPASPAWLFARIAAVERISRPEPSSGSPTPPVDLVAAPFAPRTRIDLASPTTLPAIASLQNPAFTNQVAILGQRAAAFGATAPDYALVRDTQDAGSTIVADITLLASGVKKTSEITHAILGGGGPTEWPNLVMSPGSGQVDLDAVYPDVVAERCVVFSSASLNPTTALGRITGATELSRSGFGLSAKITRMGVEGPDLTDNGYRKKVRDTAIYVETSRERLLVPDADVAMPATPTDRLIVEGKVALPVGRRIVLSGEQWTSTPGTGPIVGEAATIKSSAPAAGGNTELVFDRPIATTFRSITLKLLANVVRASHGETPASGAELLGSASTASFAPRYPLKAKPLTYVPAPSDPRGYVPAIEVRVGDREYEERPTLFELGSEDRAYTVRTGRREVSEVQFAGRLPSGTFNVSALYRTGGGKPGNLKAGRITTVMTPILGIGRVTNPVPAEGASDPETIDELRTAAPQSIRTLDRVVSLADFEAFARTRPGVGKALATELHVGMRSVVCLTIATTGLTSPVAGSDVVDGLRKALARVSVPGRAVRIEGFTDLGATVSIALAVDPSFRRADVEAAVRKRLGEAFGRATRDFGAALYSSAILAEVQGVEGVIAARLTALEVPNGPAAVDGRLSCPIPTIDNGTFVAAGLLSIDPDDVQFVEMPV